MQALPIEIPVMYKTSPWLSQRIILIQISKYKVVDKEKPGQLFVTISSLLTERWRIFVPAQCISWWLLTLLSMDSSINLFFLH